MLMNHKNARRHPCPVQSTQELITCAGAQCPMWRWATESDAEPYEYRRVWHPDYYAQRVEDLILPRGGDGWISVLEKFAEEWEAQPPSGEGWELEKRCLDDELMVPFNDFRRLKSERRGYCGLAGKPVEL